MLLAAAEALVKPCLNFWSGLWSISIDSQRPRTLLGNVLTLIWAVWGGRGEERGGECGFSLSGQMISLV